MAALRKRFGKTDLRVRPTKRFMVRVHAPTARLRFMKDDSHRLLEAARAARLHAYAPFSKFLVGAALQTADGQIITGCNVENATYGLTICAERVTVLKAISEGQRHFLRIAIVTDTSQPTPPCGACRQILWEFGGDLEVILGDLRAETARHRLQNLLPHPFDARTLEEKGEGPCADGPIPH